ncbi:hypothetical protein BT63DRAFT_481172 [Microthyrium microscopicum]|uniref:Uncharacterized protein n=1 Tax=Microthyrium microscopicum TaxID=703497 RepID=A0A6A6U5X2_9PEZI|nr:hypothetical protein BT63DRAFT_481172 [Microthyrium microscopicum]
MTTGSLVPKTFAESQGAAASTIDVPQWLDTLHSLRRNQLLLKPADIDYNISPIVGDKARNPADERARRPPGKSVSGDEDITTEVVDDDFEVDLTKAGLHNSTIAFDMNKWEEAYILLQDALETLKQLSSQQRIFCDLLALQYRLTVCAYHTEEPKVAEEALISLVEQPTSSDQQAIYLSNASHLLSLLYLRMQRLDSARSQCEKALRARGKLLGKHSDASLESIALMAHIWGLLQNPARAKAFLSMIPEARRDAIYSILKRSVIITKTIESTSLLTPTLSESSMAENRELRSPASPIASPTDGNIYKYLPAKDPGFLIPSAASQQSYYNPRLVPQSPATASRQHHRQHTLPYPAGFSDIKNSSFVFPSSSGTSPKNGERANFAQSTYLSQSSAASPHLYYHQDSSVQTTDLQKTKITSTISPSSASEVVSSSVEGDKGNLIRSTSSAQGPAPAPAFQQYHHRNISSSNEYPNDTRIASMVSSLSTELVHRPKQEGRATSIRSTNLEAFDSGVTNSGEARNTSKVAASSTMSRKDILNKVGCQPRDPIEEAVCVGDNTTFIKLLSKRKDFWRAALRKRGSSERVSALHFAALFGEVDMAQKLLASNFSINEVPFGYSVVFTPLKFAIGARQMDMVEFLVANGARPAGLGESWSTLASQLMNRSWLMKTLSEDEKQNAPTIMISILGILLRCGWDINTPFESSGKTILHQAVTFRTGATSWDEGLRTALTNFLCARGANPYQANGEDKTSFDLATIYGHQELLPVLSQGLSSGMIDNWSAGPFELQANLSDNGSMEPVELPANN